MDDARVARAQLGIADAESVGGARAKVLHHDVRADTELLHERAPGVGGEVDRAASLPPVDREVVRSVGSHERRSPAARLVAAAGTLHLHDVRAEVGEEHRAVRAREHARQVDDSQAAERRGHARHGSERRCAGPLTVASVGAYSRFTSMNLQFR